MFRAQHWTLHPVYSEQKKKVWLHYTVIFNFSQVKYQPATLNQETSWLFKTSWIHLCGWFKRKLMTPQQLSFALFVKCLHWSSRKSLTRVKLKCKNVTTHSPVYISCAMRLLLRTNGFDLHKNPKPKKAVCKPKASLFVQPQLLHYELLMLVLRQFCTFI